MAKMMKFPGNAIVPGSAANYEVNGRLHGFEFLLRLKYYRGLFLSCTDAFSLTVDGAATDPLDVAFSVNGKEFCVSQLQELISEFWLITEPARITVRSPGGLAPGKHTLELNFLLRSPYLPNFDASVPNRYVQIDNTETCEIEIAERSAAR